MGESIDDIIDYLIHKDIYVDKNINQAIRARVDKGLIDGRKNRITNNKIEVSLERFYARSVEELRNISKYYHLVDFNNPYKKSLVTQVMGIPLKRDAIAPNTRLYGALLFAYHNQRNIKLILKDLDLLEKRYNERLSKNDGSNINIKYEDIKVLQQHIKDLDRAYTLILDDPNLKRFYYYWVKYIERSFFINKCVVNDEAYRFVGDYDELIIKGTSPKDMYRNVFDKYNLIVKSIDEVNRSKDTFLSFANDGLAQYYYLASAIYNEKMVDRMIETIDNFKQKLIDDSKDKNNADFDKIKALDLIKGEFIKLKEVLDKILFNQRLRDYAFNVCNIEGILSNKNNDSLNDELANMIVQEEQQHKS